MRARYYSQSNSDGATWTVFDRTTGAPAQTNGNPHDSVPGEDVDELVDMLNGVEARQKAVTKKASRFRLKIRRDRYHARQESDGAWFVFDSTTGGMAEVTGSSVSGLTLEDADELVDMLNQIEAKRV